jgi:predicted RNA-binding protein
MKSTVSLLTFSIIFLISCNQNNKQEANNTVEKINIKPLENLIPIDTIDTKSNNVFEKYGLEFNGNCYACDLANISVTGKQIRVINVCDEKQTEDFEIVEITGDENKIMMKTLQNKFEFIKIDKAPIYELKISGNALKNKNLRISRYYTLKQLLNKFKQHDCGDFQG